MSEIRTELLQDPPSGTETADELRRLYAYMLATDIITRMLDKGLISLVEFNKIDAENIRSFSPPHARLLPNYG